MLIAAALLLAACAPVDGPADRPPDREPVRVDESLGVVRVAPGSPVEVRMTLDVDGDDEALSALLEAAFAAAIEDFGAVQQGFRVHLGKPIATSCDRGSGERAGRTLAEEAVEQQVVGVLGPQCTATLLGLQGPASDAGLAIVTPRPQEVTLTEGPDGTIGQDRRDGVFRTAPSGLAEARAAARHAIEDLELARAAAFHDGTIESLALAEAFRLTFESDGGTVVATQQVDASLAGSDGAVEALGPLLDAVTTNEADVILLALEGDALLMMLEALSGRTRLSGIARLTTSTGAGTDVLSDDASSGLLIAGPALAFPDAVSAVTGMSASQTFERVSAASGVPEPSGWWAYAYDAATLLLKAIEDSSLVDVDGSFVLSRADLRETLIRTRIGGLTGQVRCGANGDCAAPVIVIRERSPESATTLAELPVTAVLGD